MASRILVFVKDNETGNPVVDASIKFGTAIGTSDGGGKKVFVTTYKSQTIKVTKTGYFNYSKSFSTTSDKTIDIMLRPEGVAPPPTEEPPPAQWPPKQEGDLGGRLTDKYSKAGIQGVKISLANAHSTHTNNEGSYLFQSINAVNYSFKAEKTGYHVFNATINVIANQTTIFNVILTPLEEPEEPEPEPPPPIEPEIDLPENWNQLSAAEQQTFLNEISGMKSGATEPIDFIDFALLIGPGSLLSLGKGALSGLFNATKISIPRLATMNEAGFVNLIKSAPKVIEAIQIKTAEGLAEIALKHPDDVVKWFNSLPPGAYEQFLRVIKDPIIKYSTDQTVKRLILDAAKKNLPLTAKLLNVLPTGRQTLVLGAGIAAIGSWASIDNLGWVLTGAIRDLINAKEYDRALDSIDFARTTLKGIYANPVWQIVAGFFSAGMAKGIYDGMFLFLDDQEAIALKGKAEGKLGSISIKTVPAGATIWIDNKQKTFPSNTVYDEQTLGAHKVRVELKGFVTFEKEIEVKLGEQTELIHEFELIGEEIPGTAGRLQWNIIDATTNASIGASFFIGERLEKPFASAYTVDLKPGVYEFKWTAIGYEDYTDTVGIEEGKLTDLTIKMIKLEVPEEEFPGVTCETLGYLTTQPDDSREYKPVSVRGLTCFELVEVTTGTLELSSNPEAEIYIVGKKFPNLTPTNIPLEQGMYDITLKAEGYKDEIIRVYINARQTIVRSITLHKEEEEIIPRKVWRIDVASLPSSAKILINYAFTDKFTPDYILLDPGEYLFTLTKSQHKPYHVPLTLEEF